MAWSTNSPILIFEIFWRILKKARSLNIDNKYVYRNSVQYIFCDIPQIRFSLGTGTNIISLFLNLWWELAVTYIAIFLKLREKPECRRLLRVFVHPGLYVCGQEGEGHFAGPVVEGHGVAGQDLQLVDQVIGKARRRLGEKLEEVEPKGRGPHNLVHQFEEGQ